MKKFSRIWALLMALVMVLSLAACGTPADTDKETEAKTEAVGDNKTTEADKETEAPTETAFDPRSVCEGVTITIAVPETVEIIDWNTNGVTLMVEEVLGVNLEFEAYASADYYDKLNVMVNGGDTLPDVIFGSGATGIPSATYMSWVTQEAIIPLNEFYANPDYAVYINQANEKQGVDIGAMMADADGNIWGAPMYLQYPTNEVPTKLWINAEYVKELGFDEVPTTAEGFYELCKAFKAAGDINGNGVDDELCFTGRGDKMSSMLWFKYLMSPFAYAWDDNFLDVEDGTLSFSYTSDGWKEGLKYLKKFIDEGLLDSSVLTQDKASYNALVTDPMDGRPNILADFGYQPAFTSDDKVLQRATRLKYDYVPALEGPDGTAEAVYSPTIPYVGVVITADCENPGAAFLVLDLLCSEKLSITNRYGQQGVDWDYWEDVTDEKIAAYTTYTGATKEDFAGRIPSDYPEPIFMAYSDGTYWGKGNPQNAGYMQAGVAIQGQDMYWGIAAQFDANGDENEQLRIDVNAEYIESIGETLKYIPEESVITLPMTVQESEDVNNIQTTLDNYVLESIGAFLTGQWDIDTYWDTYLSELDKIGIDDALAIYQTSYDRTK